MRLQPGDLLRDGRYRIVEEVGSGGFGTVYRAIDTQMWDQPVAIKVSTPDFAPARSPSEQDRLQGRFEMARRQFEDEARLLHALRHPNLPRVTDYFVEAEPRGQFMVMDFIAGVSLAELLESRGGPLPEAEALHYVRQVSNALAYIHARTPPIIHRDVKPANIILTADNHVFLVDFGIAKVDLGDGQLSYTQRGVSAGYSPLEQYSRLPTTPRSDLYALGATLYRLLTYGGEDDGGLPDAPTRAVQPDLFRPPVERNPAVSAPTSDAVVLAMRVAAEERPASVAEWLALLPELPYAPAPQPAPPRPAPDLREATAMHPESASVVSPSTPAPAPPAAAPAPKSVPPAARPPATPGPKSKLPVVGGTWLGRYRVERTLWDYGRVASFLAEDAVLHRPVVIWLWERNYHDPGPVHKRLSRYAALQHEAIATVLGHGNSDGHAWLAFPHLPGPAPDGWPDGKLSLRDAGAIVDRLAAALDYAHGRGVVHGDLRPKHVLFDDAGGACLAFVDPVHFIAEARRDTEIGDSDAYDYRPQAEPGVASVGNDVYALGALAFRLLAGVSPLGYKAADPPPGAESSPVAAARRELPEPIRAVLDRAMAKKPERRYATAGALAERFRAAIEAVNADQAKLERVALDEERAEIRAKRKRPNAPRAAAGPKPLLPIDQTFEARYEIKELLADDGDSQLLLANDTGSARAVAVRIWRWANLPAYWETLARAAKVKGAAIVPILATGQSRNPDYLVTPHYSGGALGAWLAQGPMSLSTAAAVTVQIADALNALHGHGLIHGWLSPQSILFDAERRAWLSLHDADREQGAARPPHKYGARLLYASPQRMSGYRQLDWRTDIYSLGVILFEMLTGAPPFDGSAPDELKKMHLTAAVPSARARRPELPAAVDDVIKRALAKNPADRYYTALDMRDALRRALAGRT